jgi:dsDNA-binding SOS-regulon protein
MTTTGQNKEMLRMNKLSYDQQTISNIQELLEANQACREKLHAAARTLDDEERQRDCVELARYLTEHEDALKRILRAAKTDYPDPPKVAEILDALFESIRGTSGTPGVIDLTKDIHEDLKQQYDQAIEECEDEKTEEVLRKQRENVKDVAQKLEDAPTEG